MPKNHQEIMNQKEEEEEEEKQAVNNYKFILNKKNIRSGKHSSKWSWKSNYNRDWNEY